MNNLLKTLSVCGILFIQATLFAEDFNTVSLEGSTIKAEAVNMFVIPDNGLLLNFEKPVGITSFFQFSAVGKGAMSVQLSVSDNSGHIQTITKQMEIGDRPALYELGLLNYLTESLQNNPEASVKSVKFINDSNNKILVKAANFSNTSINYPIGINQVFVLDKMTTNKRYYLHCDLPRMVNVSIYDSKGVLQRRDKVMLNLGDNYFDLSLVEEYNPDKYVILVTEITNTNVSNTLTVMF